MPIYTYQCQYCGNVFEELTNDYSKKISYCPTCEDNGLASESEKVMSVSNFQIHGFNEKNGYSDKR